MKDGYQKPIIEIVKFQELGIETASAPDQSTYDLSVWDWFNDGSEA